MPGHCLAEHAERVLADIARRRKGARSIRKAELAALLATADELPPLLHPAMTKQYRLRVRQLYEGLRHASEEKRIEAIRSLAEGQGRDRRAW